MKASVMIALALTLVAPPAAVAAPPAMVVDSLDGPVTAREIDTFVAHMAEVTPPGSNLGNAMVYGAGGRNAEALGQLYEVSGQTRILDKMLVFTDRFLASRNNPATGRVLWTGKRELAWPNKSETDVDARYSATENGDVIARIAYAAKLVLQTRALWHKTVPGGDPNGYGTTYLARAKTYVRELDRTIDTFVAPHLVRPGTNRYHFPDSDAWGSMGPRYEGNRGKPVPWNQQTMLSGGFQRLAECHELLNDDPARVKRYDAIVKTNIDWFLSDVKEKTFNGQKTYDWGYSAGRVGEDTGHGAYDVLGLYRAFARTRYGVPRDKVATFARTLNTVMHPARHEYTKRVNGTDGVQNYMLPEWLLLAAVDPAVYRNVADSNVVSGRQKSTPAIHASIVWVKNARAKGTFPR